MLRFLFIWSGQVAAGCGSMFTTFCLGIWLYRESESVTQFSLLLFFHTVPAVLLAGAAGKAADRWNRRRTMMVSDGLNILVTLVLIVLFRTGSAQAWHVYLLTFAAGSLGAFHFPAYRSWSTQIVEARHFGRMGGITKLGEGIPFLLGPALGGALMTWTSLPTIFAINLAGFIVSIAILAAVGGRGAEPAVAGQDARHDSGGWAPLTGFLRTRPGLIGLLILSPFIVFTEGWVVALFQPFMLIFLDPARMGLMLSLGGTGMVAGGIVMGIWGGPRRQIFSVLASILVQTLLIGYLAITRPDFWTGTIVAFLYFFSIPFLSGSNQAIWQVRTPTALQGRMFAFRRAIETVATPASLLSAGLMVDYAIKPLLATDSALLSWVGGMVPEGPGRGIACLFLAVSALNLATLAAAMISRPVRRVDLDEVAVSGGDGEPDPSTCQPTEFVANTGRSA